VSRASAWGRARSPRTRPRGRLAHAARAAATDDAAQRRAGCAVLPRAVGADSVPPPPSRPGLAKRLRSTGALRAAASDLTSSRPRSPPSKCRRRRQSPWQRRLPLRARTRAHSAPCRGWHRADARRRRPRTQAGSGTLPCSPCVRSTSMWGRRSGYRASSPGTGRTPVGRWSRSFGQLRVAPRRHEARAAIS
jgi:hypothetical protein